MASEPSHKRKRVAIDHAAARRARNDAQPLGRPPEEPRLAPAGRARGADGASDRMRGAGQRAHAGAAPRRTRIPYAEHGMPVRQRPDRAATTQHARLAQGCQGRRAVPFYDEPPRAARGRQQQPPREAPGRGRGGHAPSRPTRGAKPSHDLTLQTPPMGGSARALNPNAGMPAWVKGIAALVVLIVALWAGSRLFSCVAQQPAEQPGDEPAPAISASTVLEERLASYAPYEDPSPTDLDSLSDATGISGFSLSGQEGVDDPSLSDESRAAIDAAMAPFVDGGYDVGFVLMDIGTGRGFACNVDEPIYGASSFKGPYCAFVAETYVDGGEVALSEMSDSFFNAIVYSDNGTYDAMRERFSDARLVSWLGEQGVGSRIAYDTWYPTYTTRDSAKLWLATHGYLESGSAAADELIDYYGRTRTSFTRTAITDAEDEPQGADGSEDAQAKVEEASLGASVSSVLARAIEDANADEVAVFDKAGWYPRDEDDIPAIVDAGIVECNGRDYLLCVMTAIPWSEPNQKTAEALIEAVFNARNDLG